MYYLFEQLYFPLKLIAALRCGLVAKVFSAFSTFVMKALVQQTSAQGIATMQSINITVINHEYTAPDVGYANVLNVDGYGVLAHYPQL
jgi:uncharacterized membrane protein